MRIWIAAVSVILVLVSGASTAGGGVTLARKGKAQCQIVIPVDASPAVRHAADELARYLGQIAGADFPVVTESAPKEGTPLDVGPTAWAQSQYAKTVKGNSETACIRVDKHGVILWGPSDRGTLFAVYRFLEALGCRWLAADYEFVPKKDRLRVAFMESQSSPAFSMRVFKSRDEDDSSAWGLKVGLNGFYGRDAFSTNGGCYYLAEQLPSTHTWARVIAPKKYFKEHPEWYPLLDGKRVESTEHNAQLCVTADGLAEEFAKNITEVFDEDPQCPITSISPNDGYGWCECDACNALDKKLCGGRMTQQGLSDARPFRGDRVFWFSNEVASRVTKKYPEKMLLVLAYVNYAEPPDTIRPLPNVVPWLCHYAPADYSRSIDDPSSTANAQFNTLLRKWSQSAPHLLFYEYVSKSMWWRMPRPVLRPFSADIKYLYSLGLSRYYFQSSLSDWPLDGPLYYVLAKLLWDPSQDPQVLARDWVEHMFPGAAKPMMRFYQAVDDSVRKTGRSFSENPPRDVPGLYAIEELDKARAAIEEAVSFAHDSAVADRLAQVRKTFLYGYYMIKAMDEADAFKQNRKRESIQQAAEYGKQALSYGGNAKATAYVESLDRRAGRGKS